uniref:Ig-like domain-containing protein n=1 Tax=Oryzias melastigma TaxID=30732 RepID=A0A3B3BYK6_ORYME
MWKNISNFSDSLFLPSPLTQQENCVTITLTCEVQGDEGVQWMYEWRTPQSQTSWRNNKDWTITASISGEYSCKSRSTYYSYPSTNWSEALSLSVSGSPVEGRVNMSCLVKNSSSGWRFFWFRGEKSSKLLTTQDADFLSNGQISVSQEGVYRCRGGRGEPVYHSEFSDPVIVDGEFNHFEKIIINAYSENIYLYFI